MTEAANIFILVDGLGWEWVKSLPFLADVAPYRRRLDTVLGYSAGAIPSILTGRYPSEHGRMAMFHRAANGNSPFLRFQRLCSMPPALVENRYVRHALGLMTTKLCGFTGYFNLYAVPLRYLPLLDVGEKRDIYKPHGIPGTESIFDLLKARNINYRAYSYHQGSDAQILNLAELDLFQSQASFYFLYLAEIDAFLHEHAGDARSVADKLMEYSARLTHLYEFAVSRHGAVRFHVFSDHGMAPTRRTLDVQAVLDRLSLKPPDDYLCLLDSTMARFWFDSMQARDAVQSALPECGTGRWLGEDELRSLRAWFSDRRYGEDIYLMSEGSVIEPSHMGRVAPRGMHGFHPSEPHSAAMMVSSEDYGNSLNHITDIFHVMRAYC